MTSIIIIIIIIIININISSVLVLLSVARCIGTAARCGAFRAEG